MVHPVCTYIQGGTLDQLLELGLGPNKIRNHCTTCTYMAVPSHYCHLLYWCLFCACYDEDRAAVAMANLPQKTDSHRAFAVFCCENHFCCGGFSLQHKHPSTEDPSLIKPPYYFAIRTVAYPSLSSLCVYFYFSLFLLTSSSTQTAF